MSIPKSKKNEFFIEFFESMVYNMSQKGGVKMTDAEQKQIFAKNLNKYLALNQKQQIEVAKDLGFNPTTFNMWCKGNTLPNVGKIQKIADYFGIGKSALTDENNFLESDNEHSALISQIAATDKRFQNIILNYNKLPKEKKELLCDFLENFVFENQKNGG